MGPLTVPLTKGEVFSERSIVTSGLTKLFDLFSLAFRKIEVCYQTIFETGSEK